MNEVIASSIAAVRNLRLVVIQLAGNLILIAGTLAWLIIPDKHTAQLLLSAVLAIVLLAIAVLLHAGTLSFANAQEDSLSRRFLVGLRHAAAFIFVVVLMLFLMKWVLDLNDRMWQISGYVYSKVPSFVRSWLGPDRFKEIGEYIISIKTFYLVPVLLLPFAAGAATFGFGRDMFFGALRALRSGWYWLWFAALAALGVWIPSLLLNWTHRSTLTAEATSAAFRFAAAYLLAVLCWVAVAGMLGRFMAAESAAVADVRGKPIA